MAHLFGVLESRGRKVFFLPVSLVIHGGVVLAFLMLSAFSPEALPLTATKVVIPDLWTLAPRVHADPLPHTSTKGLRKSGGAAAAAHAMVAPTVFPDHVPEQPSVPIEEIDNLANGCLGCEVGIPSDLPPGPDATGGDLAGGGGGPVRVVPVSQVRPPRKLKDQRPVYPPIAITAGIQGQVVIECTIGTDGRISALRVVKSVPLLDQAATDAVQQWVYTPTLLDGVPVAVVMNVTVTFQTTRR